jgi:hypothetical protein
VKTYRVRYFNHADQYDFVDVEAPDKESLAEVLEKYADIQYITKIDELEESNE